MFEKIKKMVPHISKTEQEALNSGDTWLDQDIFQNKINWDELENIKYPLLKEKEQHFIDNELNTLLSMLDNYKINKDEKIPEDVLTFLRENKFFAFIIPEEYGGLGFSPSANSYIVSKISSVNASVAVTVMVPNSLGPAELLLKYGTTKEKNYWLPRLASGVDIPCFGLTSPFAGSDAGSIPDKAIVVKKEIDGKEILGLSLTVNKRYITLAPIATVLGVAFQVEDPENLLEGKFELGITCALIPSSTDGLDMSHYHKPMNMAFKNGTIKGENVFIPIDSVIGGRKNIGRGWSMLMNCLADGRGISLPALSAAKAQVNFHQTFLYSNIREQFGHPIAKFEGIEEKLAEMLIKNYIIESTRKLTLYGLDKQIKPAIITAITKYHLTEYSRDILLDSMDIMAGKSIIQGRKNPSWDSYIGMPIAITVEGANILTRNLIIMGQGSVRCHPYLLDELSAIDSNDKEKLYDLLLKHSIHFLKQMTITKAKYWYLMFKSKNELDSLKSYINYYSGLLYVLTDLSLLLLGGKFKYKENLTARLSDLLSKLYMALAVYVNYKNNPDKENETLAIASIQLLLKEINDSLMDFYNLFPSYLMMFVKFGTSPFGLFNFGIKQGQNKKVLSSYDHKLQKQMTNLVYFDDIESPIYQIERAYNLKQDADKILTRINIDNNLTINSFQPYFDNGEITNSELELLNQYNDALLSVINVDEFKSYQKKQKSTKNIKKNK